jgi:hypothetical protein
MREKGNIAKSSDLECHIRTNWKHVHGGLIDHGEDLIKEGTLIKEGSKIVELVPGSGTITLADGYNVLHYMKIGRMITLTGKLWVESISTSPPPSGDLKITGLPFGCEGAYNYPIYSQYQGAISVYADSLAQSSITAIQGWVDPDLKVIYLSKFMAGEENQLAGDVLIMSTFIIGGTYFI